MRHAQRYWLEVQAGRAVEVASRVRFQGAEAEVEDEVEKVDATLPSADVEALALRHELAIGEAARALVKAELLHREIARRGGHLR